MKSSHLTRAVFRAILANRPYLVADCRRRTIRNQFPTTTRPAFNNVQKRSLFTAILGTVNLGFDGAKPTPKNLELALGKLVDLVRARRTSSRPPPNDELLSAFKFILNARLGARKTLTRNEIFLVTEAFKHFQENGLVADTLATAALGRHDLNAILSTLALPSEHERFRSDTRALATLVFQSLPPSSTKVGTELGSPAIAGASLATYISVLAQSGSAVEALQVVKNTHDSSVANNPRIWINIIKGLSREAREAEYKATVAEFKRDFAEMTPSDYEDILCFFAVSDKLSEARQIYDIQVRQGGNPSTRELQNLLELCVRVNDAQWGGQLAKLLTERVNDEGVLGTLFVWMSREPKGTSELLHQIERFIHDTSFRNLSIDAFNHLFEFGLQQKRSDITSVAMRLADIFDIRPDGKSYALQLKHVLDKGDITQASLIYEQMSHEDIPSDDSDVPTLNKFLSALAFSPKPPYTLIMRLVDSILERNADFDAEALAGLCKVFLQRDELEDATGMLRHRADFYPETDRARIAAVFKDFILDPSNSDQRAFNAYEIYRFAFPETPIEQKLAIMQSFFDRKRSEFACTVFSHMRQREDPDSRPNAEAYAQCFAGIAQCRDIDGLQIVNNMLKLDLEVEPVTRIRNGMMLAYIACNLPFTAMIDNFWKILDSREGPSYSTFEIGLRACETWVPQGGYEARKIMAIVQAWDLEVTKELYHCYIGALAGQSEFEYTIELIEEMEKDIGECPDAITIGTFYNAIPWQYRKDEVEKWAKRAFPDLWQDLLEYGDEIDEEWEMRFFKIPRDIEIDDPPLFATGKYNPQISRQAVQALEPPSM